MQNTNSVIWVTGLSGSGKTTFANKLNNHLRLNSFRTVLLDGDELRTILNVSNSHFSRNERIELGFIYSRFCKYLAQQGYVVIIATIALYQEIQDWNRKNMPSYIEILMNISQKELEKRDSKNLYSKFGAGNINQVSGLDIAIDWPSAPDYTIDFTHYDFNEIAASIVLDLRNSYEK
jgi:adenylylsulfate kinase